MIVTFWLDKHRTYLRQTSSWRVRSGSRAQPVQCHSPTACCPHWSTAPPVELVYWDPPLAGSVPAATPHLREEAGFRITDTVQKSYIGIAILNWKLFWQKAERKVGSEMINAGICSRWRQKLLYSACEFRIRACSVSVCWVKDFKEELSYISPIIRGSLSVKGHLNDKRNQHCKWSTSKRSRVKLITFDFIFYRKENVIILLMFLFLEYREVHYVVILYIYIYIYFILGE